MKTKRITIHHRSVRKKFRHTMTILGCTVQMGQYRSVITGDHINATELSRQLPVWLKDGMIEGTPIETTKKGPAYK